MSKANVGQVYIALTEAGFRYGLLHELSIITHGLLYDEMYTKEEAVKDLLKLMVKIEQDKTILPTADDIQTDVLDG